MIPLANENGGPSRPYPSKEDFMRKLFPLLVLLGFAGAPARAGGLLVNLDLFGSSPTGHFNDEFGGSVNASDIFDTGGGLGGGVAFGLSPNLFVGGEIDAYRNKGTALIDLDLVDYHLTSIPILGTIQYVQPPEAGGIGFGLKGGLGVTLHSLAFDLSGTTDQSQSNFSFLIGGDLAYGLSENWALKAGFSFHETLTGANCDSLANDEGPFCNDDNPKFLLFSVGALYHRE
jgi:opacity protein-like surface antigen